MLLSSSNKQLTATHIPAIEQAQPVGARNGISLWRITILERQQQAVRVTNEDLQIGRNVSAEGQQGIMESV